MTQSELLDFMRGHRWAVQTSVSGAGAPQAALVGIAVTHDLEIVFDTLDITRRVINLRSNPKIAFVVGDWRDGDERTAQYEGVADFPGGAELRHLKDIYFGTFREKRDRQTWPGLVYVRAKPTWIRYSNFNRTPPEIHEFSFPERSGTNQQNLVSRGD